MSDSQAPDNGPGRAQQDSIAEPAPVTGITPATDLGGEPPAAPPGRIAEPWSPGRRCVSVG